MKNLNNVKVGQVYKIDPSKRTQDWLLPVLTIGYVGKEYFAYREGTKSYDYQILVDWYLLSN